MVKMGKMMVKMADVRFLALLGGLVLSFSNSLCPPLRLHNVHKVIESMVIMLPTILTKFSNEVQQTTSTIYRAFSFSKT